MTKKRNRKNSDSSETASSDSDTKTPNSKTCRYCRKKFLLSKFNAHEKCCDQKRDVETCVSPSGSKKFLCKICSQTFKYLSGLTRHEERHVYPGGFICRFCHAPFLTDFDRNTHKETFHKMYRCQICEAKFSEDKDYIEHIQNVHDGRDREYVVCTDCGQQFRTALQLKYHNESKCGTLKSYGCDQCSSKFMTQNTLNAHKLIHVGEKKHLCDYCGNSFLSKGQLKVHERSHTGEKPFKCEICAKAFSYRESLVTHSSLHTGIKPYLCEGCGSRFSCIGNLIKHRKARPESCGLPQFCKNTKIAPRASAKNPGSLTMKIPKVISKDHVKGRGPYKKKLIVETPNSETPEIKPEITEIKMTPTEMNTLINNKEEYIIEFTDLTDLDNKDFINDGDGTTVQLEPGIDFQFPGTTTVVQRTDILKCDKSIQVSDFSEGEPFQTESDYYNYIQPENNTYDEGNWEQSREVSFQDDDYDNDDDDKEDVFSDNYVINPTPIQQEQEQQTEPIQQDEIKHEENDAEFIIFKMEDDDISLDENAPLSSIKLKINNRNCIKNKTNVNKRKKIIKKSSKVKEKEKSDDESYELMNVRKGKLRKIKPKIINKTAETDSDSEISSDKDPDFIPNKINQIIDSNSSSDDLEFIPNNMNKGNDEVIVHSDIAFISNSENEFSDFELDPNELFAETKFFREKTKNNEAKRNQCNLCPKMYAHKARLIKHLNVEHQIYDDHEVFSNDNDKMKDKKHFKCKFCEKRYFSILLLEKHQISHGPDGLLIYKCSCCKQYFLTSDECEKHQIDCHEDKLYCKECKKMFKEPDNLQAHIRYAHKGTAVQKKYFYMCPQCGKNFTSKVALSDHERSNCGQSPIYKCNVCEKSYHSAGSLKTHQTIHSGELPHLCNFCGKGFRTQGQVKVHERRHNGDKPFQCEFCSKSFAYRESLLTHRSLHTGLKRFMCQACGSRFSCISNLQAHRKSHKNTCGQQPNCTKAFGPMGLIENVAATFTP